MKPLITLLCIALLLISCGNDAENKASQKLALARTAFEQGNYNQAKIELDSIKMLYPKAFKVRDQANTLKLQVEIQEQQKSLLYLDSVLQQKQQALQAIKGSYVLEKDEVYQQTGNYFWPTQTVEKNLHRSFLRFQVSEQGEMTMTSIYCGASSINHFAVKVTAPDGSFAQTPPSKDSYQTTDLGEKIEKADYKMGADGDVMGFLYLNRANAIRVEYLGDRKYNTILPAADRQALAGVYELSQLLSSIEQIKAETQEAKLKIAFVNKRMEEKKKKEAEVAK